MKARMMTRESAEAVGLIRPSQRSTSSQEGRTTTKKISRASGLKKLVVCDSDLQSTTTSPLAEPSSPCPPLCQRESQSSASLSTISFLGSFSATTSLASTKRRRVENRVCELQINDEQYPDCLSISEDKVELVKDENFKWKSSKINEFLAKSSKGTVAPEDVAQLVAACHDNLALVDNVQEVHQRTVQNNCSTRESVLISFADDLYVPDIKNDGDLFGYLMLSKTMGWTIEVNFRH